MSENKNTIFQNIFNLLKDLKYPILFFVFFTGGIISEKIYLNPGNYIIDTESVEKQIHALEKQALAAFDDIEKLVNEKKMSLTKNGTWLFDKDFDQMSQRDISIFVYESDTLRYWTNNALNAPRIHRESFFTKERVREFENGWYEVRFHNSGNLSFYGLIKIKNNFPFENKYLKNDYRNELSIPETVRISPVAATQGQNIRDFNDEYIFSLVPVNKMLPKKEKTGITGMLFFLAFGFLLFSLHVLVVSLKDKNNGIIFSALIVSAVVGLRYLMIHYKIPVFVYTLEYFEPEIYAGSDIAPFLGDLFFNAASFLFVLIVFFELFKIDRFANRFSEKAFLGTAIFVLMLFAQFALNFYNQTLLFSLVENSNIPLEIYNLPELNMYSLTAYLFIALLITALIYFTDKIFFFASKIIQKKIAVPVFVAALILSYFVSFLLGLKPDLWSVLFYTLISASIFYVRFYNKTYRYYVFGILILLSSLYVVLIINELSDSKQKLVRANLITRLLDERDDVAELFISDVEKKLNNDDLLLHYLINPVKNPDSLVYNHLSKKYFTGFWTKYDLEITICGNKPELPSENQAENCENYFNAKFFSNAKKLNNSKFTFTDNHNGTISYLGALRIPSEIDSRKVSLYIKLTSKQVSKDVGFPDLLLDENTVNKRLFSKYSFAKYLKGQLITHSGEYPYNLSDENFKIGSKQPEHMSLDGYEHTVFRSDADHCIVLSIPARKSVDIPISFAYLFVFLNILLILSLFFVAPKVLKTDFSANFNNKIRFSMLFMLLLTFIVFGLVTIYFTIKRNDDGLRKEMSDKIQSVLIETEHKLFYEKELTSDWKNEKFANLDELMTKFSQVFFTDINLYDTNGFLLATSRPEIFVEGFIGRQMNAKAFRELVVKKKTKYIQQESIGTLEYSSVYIPLRNFNNTIAAYINLPHFSNPDSLRKDISAMLVTVINVYVVLLLIVVFIAFIISSGITQPLRMLQFKFRETELGTLQQEIVYDKDDEIGGLIKEYNRMAQQLSESVKRLADTERESAWREMAKQIAHEIKNPLTPMKLSVQLLQRAWKDNKDDFDSRMTKVTAMLIEQIDTLSSIASEFSAFAKMPKAQDEEVDLASKLVTIVQLFENTKDVEINLNLNQIKSVKILADKEQLSRVFINLIKNGIQAIPEGINGKIDINLTAYGSRVKVTIKDNGSGIPEDRRDKLFVPSFTTKSKGMGMGLAIVKNIINNSGGEIWFESEPGKGTEFFVEFPILMRV